MSKHNYSQYSKKNDNPNVKPQVDEIVVDELIISDSVESVVESTAEVKMESAVPKMTTGTIANCNKLNVRAKPAADAEILCVVDCGSEVEIDKARSTSDWFRVITAAGVDGYCMRKFVNANF